MSLARTQGPPARVYLAGPDVFFPDAKARGEALKAICAKHGLEGIFPLDAEPPEDHGSRDADAIYDANCDLIESCDGVLANMTPFRGPSADAGTSWEMGFAVASGIPVVGYTQDPSDYKERVGPDGLDVEDFGLADNLMLACSVHGIEDSAEAAVMLLAVEIAEIAKQMTRRSEARLAPSHHATEYLAMIDGEGAKMASVMCDTQESMQQQVQPLLSDADAAITFFGGYFRVLIHRMGPNGPDWRQIFDHMLSEILSSAPSEFRERVHKGILERLQPANLPAPQGEPS